MGKREDRRRGMRELQGRWPGLRLGYDGRSAEGLQSPSTSAPNGRLRPSWDARTWQENRQQENSRGAGWWSLAGRLGQWRRATVRLGVEWLAVGPGLD